MKYFLFVVGGICWAISFVDWVLGPILAASPFMIAGSILIAGGCIVSAVQALPQTPKS